MSALQHFNKEIVPSLKRKLGIKNINAVPKIEKLLFLLVFDHWQQENQLKILMNLKKI
jgi:hypothetical protein